MTDFIDGLERDLVAAAERQQRARQSAAEIRRGRLGRLRSRRGLAAGFAALLVAGSATAAVISDDPGPSKPLRGAIAPASPGAREYAISMSPDLAAGAVGWCTTIRFSNAGRGVAAGTGCGPARSADGVLMAGGRLIAGRDLLLDYVVTRGEVPVVRMPNGRRIITRRDASLPAGWRAAVTVSRGNLDGPRESDIRPVPEDASGRPLVDPRAPSSFTQRAKARRVSPNDTAAGCNLGPIPSGYGVQAARVALGRPRVPNQVAGPVYFSCAHTRFTTPRLRGVLEAAVLIRPSRTGALPRPRGTSLSSRRINSGWLVVRGTPTAQRLRLLNALSPRAKP